MTGVKYCFTVYDTFANPVMRFHKGAMGPLERKKEAWGRGSKVNLRCCSSATIYIFFFDRSLIGLDPSGTVGLINSFPKLLFVTAVEIKLGHMVKQLLILS